MSFRSSAPRGFPAVRMSDVIVRFLPLLGLLLLISVLTGPSHPANDEVPLLAASHRILQGRYALVGTMDSSKFLWHGPGLPALLAPLVALGVPLNALRLTSPLLMFAAVLMFYRLLRLRLSSRSALIGAYALGLYLPAYYVLGTVGKDPLALLLAIAALDGTARYLTYARARHAVVAGLAFAALAMTRLEYGLIITVALAAGTAWWLLARLGHRGLDRRRLARRWILICAIGLLGCAPWLTYTYVLTGHVFYWGNSGGISVYWMSSPSLSQLGEWHASHSVFADPALAGYRPFFHYLATLKPVAADLELRHVALVQALAHPAKYALNLLANLSRMFIGYPFSFSLSAALIAGLIVVNGTLLAALTAASRLLIRLRGSLPPETVPFVLFGSLGFVVHLFPSAEPRMLVPLIPVAIWLIAHAADRRRPAGQMPAGRERAQTRQATRGVNGRERTLARHRTL